MMRAPLRVLVTDGASRAALAITRSLGRRGHQVLVAEHYSPALAQTSRYCAGRIVHPDPASDEDGFRRALLAAVEREGLDVLLPVTDVTAAIVSGHRAEFERFCRVPVPGPEALAHASDKARLVADGQRLGVPVPRSIVVGRPSEAGPDAAEDLPFPVVIKPHRSRVRAADRWHSCGVSYAENRAALAADLARRHPAEFPILLQERIVGPGVGVFMCYRGGQVAAVFSHRRLREKPPWGGVSVLSESMSMDPVARGYAERLLGSIGWEGVAMVEFKRDLRDGTLYLIEINGRFWGSLQLAIDAGVDFPALLVEPGWPGAPPPEYRPGVRNRWFWGDVDVLWTRLRRRRPGAAGGERLRALAEFLTFWTPGLRYDNPKLDDPKPWLYETWQWIRH